MEWRQVWHTLFCGWDGDVDLTALAEELRNGTEGPQAGDDHDTAWVCRQIQEAY
ncbi:MAG: hypothetical protein ACRDGN_06075 [bacterium]